MKSRISLGAWLALALSALGQTASGQQAATVHIYRSGSRGNAIQVLVDGAEVFKLGEHQMTTFALPPGRHEVSARYASQQPAVAIDAEPGSQYFLQLLMDVRHGILGAVGDPAMAVAVTLTREDGVLNADQIREEPLSQNEKDFIAFKISQAHPAGPMQVAESSQAPAPPPPATPEKTVAPPRAFAATQPTVGTGQAYSVKYAGGGVTDAQVGKSLQTADRCEHHPTRRAIDPERQRDGNRAQPRQASPHRHGNCGLHGHAGRRYPHHVLEIHQGLHPDHLG